jgi:imidazole glycerol-phosphate synthase subunit HisH
MKVALVDYRAGNLTSVAKGLTASGATVHITESPNDLVDARAIVIPGVGHFSATAALGEDWRRAIREAIAAGRPLLGICLGLQWLFEGSDEMPGQPGLGLFRGRCFELRGDVKVPHVGWNTLARTAQPSRLLDGLPSDASAYFTHSYAAPLASETSATTTHGMEFASVVEHGRVAGVQFHPEKSGTTGLRLLANFVALARQA